jgi:multiple sugar transport system permease protein
MEASLQQKQRRRRSFLREAEGWAYVVPVLVGIALFTVLPMIVCFVYSLFDYDPTSATQQLTNFGFQNYIRIFTSDWDGVSKTLFLTFRYALVTVVISLVGSYALALFLNQKMRGEKIYRVLFYLPCLIPAVAGTLLWKDITSVDYGYINLIFDQIGMPRYSFYNAKDTVFPTIVLLSFFGFGGNMVPWLAQMENIPSELYDAADIDGANAFQKLFHITIPMTTSMIFYLLIVSIIGALQVFSGFYPLRNGVDDSEINFIVVEIYSEAFENPANFGYACALSWFLFAIIGAITLTIFKTSKWVYYGDEQ